MTGSSAKPPGIYLELGYSSLRTLIREEGLEIPLERLENGRLNPASAEQLAMLLRAFVQRAGGKAGSPCVCAVGSRGVSTRRVSLPDLPNEEWQRLLTLQIEREFPLSPEELAWGYCPAPPNGAPAANGPGQDWLVFALKRSVLQEYADLFERCGLAPIFTLSAWARPALCERPSDTFAVLDIGRASAELASYIAGAPVSLRVLPWGSDQLTRRIAGGQGISAPEAEALRLQWAQEPGSASLRSETLAGLDEELAALAKQLAPAGLTGTLLVTGDTPGAGLASGLSRALGGLACQTLEVAPGAGRSAATLGLQRTWEAGRVLPPLVLPRSGPKAAPPRASRVAPWRWAILAGLLALVSLSLRYAEPILQSPKLERTIAELKAAREQLPRMERELAFLQYLLTNQPPYVESIHALANAAPGGMRIDSLAMSRRGDLSFRATMRDPQQLVDFRSKLLQSGLFSTVVVDEQTPSADQQKLTVRLSGQWRRPGEVKPAAPPPAANATPPAPPALAPPDGGKPAPSAAEAATAPPPLPAADGAPRPARPERKD